MQPGRSISVTRCCSGSVAKADLVADPEWLVPG